MVYEQQYNALWGQFVDLETGKFTKNPTLYSRSITPNHINYSNKNKNKMLSSISEETNDDINNFKKVYLIHSYQQLLVLN